MFTDSNCRKKPWSLPIEGFPAKLSASPAVIKRSPTLGEHTDEILQEVLGYQKEKISTLKSAGAFGLPPKKAA